jgi:hypothetical protein
MTKWMRGWLLVAGLAAIVGVVGCEWESSGDEAAWNSSYNWMDFSGMYADVGQGVFVKDAATAFDITPTLVVGESLGAANGSATSFSGAFAHDGIVRGSVLLSAGPINFIDDGTGGLGSSDGWGAVSSESGGTGDGIKTAFNGLTVNHPVVVGSFSVQAGGTTFTDDGSGTLVSSGLAAGTIVHETGAWSIQFGGFPLSVGADVLISYQYSTTAMAGSIVYSTGGYAVNLQGQALAAGTPITVTYRYTQTTSASQISGNSGDPIYTMTILQTGQKLRFIDSNGNSYEGSLYDVNSTAEDLTEVPASDVAADTGATGLQGEMVASFYAEGTAYGQLVTIEGTFVGNLIGTTENTLFDRHMNGTWRESGGKVGVFFGFAASSAVPLPLIPSNVVINLP